jgi:hypothetical protein
MPVISYNHSSAALTDACVVMIGREVFTDPKCVMSDTNGDVITPVEFRAINWKGVFTWHYLGGKNEGMILIDMPACDLSEHKVGVCQIRMQTIACRYAFAGERNKFIVPRIKWLVNYKQLQERRTALAMALHHRLGSDCLIRQLDNEIMQCILRYDV